ncbi:MAG: hypothetical protein EWV55_00855 [Microcystis viridis Mv_BB_P_19951000_S69]|uniref:Uncharacterized protein n=1 Tax=Microcystis viridis Mv_BB_P_19951000_S68D TaxID=2486270 RepID=A0A552I1R1_MICVR|nr:MAG: hypothetical protein EWV47_10545 [Microcystis viridis Mv_BB_P_19951000_S68]TRU77405.1 MAG: hypothetical protein EWV77_05775 [Microcystis viridis Mv_BB_P_19951000_S68D]TRU79324.1 MAG: hypothetical protein EWV55_00855 [Microcystis viridis Mv_BB_P_19951000_S69]TRU87911.1 MAG: hypothetical protein EWV46_07335 [Microcystis viridis Mv_BB_P_19951000_S69D]
MLGTVEVVKKGAIHREIYCYSILKVYCNTVTRNLLSSAFQLSVISYQLSVIRFELSVIN